MFTASIIVPCFDEADTLRESVERVLKIADEHLALEIIVVDDCSRDGSGRVARELETHHLPVTVYAHEVNRGKGAAIRTGFENASGDVVAIHDADLEYDPGDLRKLIELVRVDKADVVFGSRFLSAGEHRVLYFWHSMGNRFLTFLSNMFTDLNLTDMEACYKVFRRETIEGIEISEDRFGFEPEIVAKVSERRPRIYELGISYFGRTYEDGKKIGYKDGLRALYCILRYNAYRSPLPLQFCAWFPGAALAIVLGVIIGVGASAAELARGTSMLIGYMAFLAIHEVYARRLIFLPGSRWKRGTEMIMRIAVFALGGIVGFIIATASAVDGSVSLSGWFAALGAAALIQYFGCRFAVYSARGG